MDDLEIALGKLCQTWIERIGLEQVLDALDGEVTRLEERAEMPGHAIVPNPSVRLQ